MAVPKDSQAPRAENLMPDLIDFPNRSLLPKLIVGPLKNMQAQGEQEACIIFQKALLTPYKWMILPSTW